MNFILDRLGVRDLFSVIVQGGEVSRGKPAPDIYLRAADELGVEPCACVVFEDSSAGVESAKRAGMICIGLDTALSAAELTSAHADFVISDFREIHPDKLLAMIEKRQKDCA